MVFSNKRHEGVRIAILMYRMHHAHPCNLMLPKRRFLEGLTNLLQSNVLKVPVSPVSPIKLTMELAPASGALKGSFMLSGVRTSFSGVVFQKTNDASGFFLSGTKGLTKSGLIQISKKE